MKGLKKQDFRDASSNVPLVHNDEWCWLSPKVLVVVSGEWLQRRGHAHLDVWHVRSPHAAGINYPSPHTHTSCFLNVPINWWTCHNLYLEYALNCIMLQKCSMCWKTISWTPVQWPSFGSALPCSRDSQDELFLIRSLQSGSRASRQKGCHCT